MSDWTKREMMIGLAAVLTTLAEVDGSPESMLYIAVAGMDIHRWGVLREILVERGLVTVAGHYVRITERGRQLAAEINRAVGKPDTRH